MPDNSFRRKIALGAGAAGAAVLLGVLAMQAFGSTPPPPPSDGWLPTNVAAWVFGASSTSGFMIVLGPLFAAWGFSVHLRCSDAQVRRCLKGVAVLAVLWMADVLLKYRYPGESDQVILALWYLYYVPFTLMPALCLICALRVAAFDAKPFVRTAERTLLAIAVVIILFVLTNSVHEQVFVLDFDNGVWRGAYTYNWGYWAIAAWYAAECLAFICALFVAAHRRLRASVLVLAIAAVLLALYCLLYALRSEFAIATNVSLTYCVAVIVMLELALDFGILPSYLWYGEAFARLPVDLKVLDRNLSVVYCTDVAAPLPNLPPDLLSSMVREKGKRGIVQHRTTAAPHALFKAYGVSGGMALLTEDVAALDERRELLRRRQERLRRSNEVLRHEGEVARELWRQESERRLARTVEGSIADKVARTRALLAALPQGDDDAARAARRSLLTEVKLVVAYCKRKGSLVISEQSDPEFDRQRLSLVFNETVADLRSLGVECAVMVEVARTLPAAVVSVLYDCLYDVAAVALFADRPVLMLFVHDGAGGVEMRAALEAAHIDAERLDEAIGGLRSDLCGQGANLALATDANSLNVTISMCAEQSARKASGEACAKRRGPRARASGEACQAQRTLLAGTGAPAAKAIPKVNAKENGAECAAGTDAAVPAAPHGSMADAELLASQHVPASSSALGEGSGL